MNTEIIDLRSDTVSKPTPAMREAMYRAEVGDDVYGEDPTVNRLEAMAAGRLGKDAGLFLPSGTMGNLVAILAHCQRGEEALMGHLGHTFLFEVGGISALGGIFANTLLNQPDGSLLIEDIRSAIRGEDIHQPQSRLVILENTHNRCGGVVLSSEYTQTVGELVHSKGLKLHLDGARIFNAAAALGISASELASPAESVTFCLSKGLCAPVGSVLCGSVEFITRSRKIRKQLGGGMRQAGILAAAGIVALETMVDRLGEDHLRAQRLATGLSSVEGLHLTYGKPATNMVFVSLDQHISKTASEISTQLFQKGIKVGATGSRSFRLVTHYWIDDQGVENTINAFREAIN